MTALEQESERIAAARADTRTPAVVRRAMLRPGVLTLRRFLELEEAASPVLDGRWPRGNPAAMAEAFCTARAILFPGEDLPAADGLQSALSEMQAEVDRAFSTVMPMRFPRRPGDALVPPSPDGLGWVVRMLGRFVALGWKPADVLDLPMDQLFILRASLQANDGGECAGEDYRDRRAETGGRKEGSAALGGGTEDFVADVVIAAEEPTDGTRQRGEKEKQEDGSDHEVNVA